MMNEDRWLIILLGLGFCLFRTVVARWNAAIRQSGPHRSTESAHAMGDGHPRALPTRRAQAAGRDAAAAPAAVAADPVERDGHPGVADQKGGN
jgi:hypothetical protein